MEDLASCADIKKFTAAVEDIRAYADKSHSKVVDTIHEDDRYTETFHNSWAKWKCSTTSENMVRNVTLFFAAAGHSLYAKSVHLHLQNMITLDKRNQIVYSKCMERLFVVRRNNRYWGGLAPDLVIEQALMRSLKSTGGLTRGRGMPECQRSIWTLSMPICAQINESMQDLAGPTYSTSEQHVESSRSRMTKHKHDTDAVITFLKPLQPFSEQKCYATS